MEVPFKLFGHVTVFRNTDEIEGGGGGEVKDSECFRRDKMFPLDNTVNS